MEPIKRHEFGVNGSGFALGIFCDMHFKCFGISVLWLYYRYNWEAGK